MRVQVWWSGQLWGDENRSAKSGRRTSTLVDGIVGIVTFAALLEEGARISRIEVADEQVHYDVEAAV
ncbi:hypothetical protein ACT7DA_12245 [Bacillus pacificus]